MPTSTNDLLTVGMAQIAPVWLQREQTITKVLHKIEEAGEQGWVRLFFAEAAQ